MPKVSVIIPVYNAEKYLGKCLNSVVNQTLEDIEIVCVNDCSSDKSLDILKEYAQKYHKIKVIDCTVNGGESVARNIGLRNVTGNYVAFVDNDDVIDLDFYEKLYKRAIETNADITKAEFYSIDYNGKKYKVDNQNKGLEENKYLFYYPWWTAIYKKSFLTENNIKLPEGFLISGDIIFLNEAIIKANKLVTVDGTFYCHIDRINSGFSHNLSEKKVKSGLNAIKIVLENTNADKMINDKGYDFIWLRQFDILINIRNHNDQNYLIDMFVDTAFFIYEHCKRKEAFINNLILGYCDITQCLINNDKCGLKKEFLEIKSRQNSIIKALRLKIKRGL